MAKVEITVCDKCDKETRDPYSEIGWLIVDGHVNMTNGRAKDKQAKTHWLGPNSLWHFCSFKCLEARLRVGRK